MPSSQAVHRALALRLRLAWWLVALPSRCGTGTRKPYPARLLAWALLHRPSSLTDHAQVVKATSDTVAHSPTKTIDILVNSAGITGPNETLAKYPIDAWHQVMQINLNALFYCCREIVPVMQANDSGKGYGRIVNIASVAGKEGNPNASAYGASKGAVMTLTKSLGKELAATGIRVNCVTPAAVDSPMFAQMKPEFIQYMLSKIPMARFGQADEVAALVTWLSTEDCSFSTGAVFDISGGRATY
jgi:2-dehydro-3-deoxy-L-rhamnonate dehydrogenase (NAD+)